MLAFPTRTTFQVLPWRPEERAARVFCDIRTRRASRSTETPAPACKSTYSARQTSAAMLMNGPKLEYFTFDKSTSLVPVPLGLWATLTLTSRRVD